MNNLVADRVKENGLIISYYKGMAKGITGQGLEVTDW
jgi:hypothetical protein